jgi:predicted dehydrogenase
MDGVMFMHSRRLQRIGEVLRDGRTMGPIRRITSAFAFRAEEEFFGSNIRVQSELEPYGCLGDLGWYCIRFALWAMNGRLPQRVTGLLLSEFKHSKSKRPVPTEFSGDLFFEGGVSSSFYCSFLTETQQWVFVSGTRGHLRVPDFVLPFAGTQISFETENPGFRVQGCDFEMTAGRRRWVVNECAHSDASSQESRMFRDFTEQVQSGILNPAWPEMAFKTQAVMQDCHESSLARGRPVRVPASAGTRGSI